jgi:hypothetical protein
MGICLSFISMAMVQEDNGTKLTIGLISGWGTASNLWNSSL